MKQKGQDVFTIDNLDEAQHFFLDLRPSLLLLDADLAQSHGYVEIVEKANEIPVVYIGDDNQNYMIKKPVDVMSLLDQLEELYNRFHG